MGSVVAALAEEVFGVIIGRALQGSGAIAAVILALVADLTREQQRIKAMALMGMSIGASFLAALMIGPVLDQWFGMSGLFWLTAVLSVAAIGVVLRFVPAPSRTALDPGVRAVGKYFADVLRDHQLLRLDIGILILHMVLTAMFVAIPFSLVGVLGFEREAHWEIYVPVLIVSILLMAPLLITSMRRQNTFAVFRVAIAILTLAFIILLLSSTTAVLLVIGLCVFFVGFNLLEAMLPSLVTRIAPGYAKGTATGVYNTFEFSGVFMGGAVGGMLYGSFGVTGVFCFCAIASAAWLVVSFSGPRPVLHESLTLYLDDDFTDVTAIEKALRSLVGVHDVSLFFKERVAYLRIDAEEFDRNQLNQINGLVRSQS